MNQLLLKGFEVELFTGNNACQPIGCSAEVSKEFQDFVTEPDQRNIEYITQPEKKYENIKELLLEPRRRLRAWLKGRELTILPGSTMSLGDSNQFQRSNLSNSYHQFIEENYGAKVVTASVHINLGIEELSVIFAALRLARCEAALFLALSASSPFLDGSFTGFHSQRWIQFPKTPKQVPLFVDHREYIDWIEAQLKTGSMRNERHLWTSVRPNGTSRPYKLNRLELRICDLITNCNVLLAITALLELRVLSMINNPTKFDPYTNSKLNLLELSKLCDMNEIAAAQNSLDATLHHWFDGQKISCRTWISQLLEEVNPLAQDLGLLKYLAPIQEILDGGNQSMQWLQSFHEGIPISILLRDSIKQMESEEDMSKQQIDFNKPV